MLMFTQFDIFKGICLLTFHKIKDWSLFIGRGGEGGGLVQIGGGPPLFMHGLKGGPLKNMQTFCQQKC